MIPFKPKTNGTCAAILLILVCLSGTCASIRADREESSDARVRSAENSRQTRNGVISHDVRADSRQSRIDSSDIRTDFREIRTELPRSASRNYRQYRPERSADRRFADRVVTERRQLDRRALERSRQTRTIREARSDLRDREANRRIFDEDRNMSERETNRRSDASRQTRTIREARSDLREREANRRFSNARQIRQMSEDRESDRRIISNGRLSEYRAQSENRIEASTRRLSDARQNRLEEASNTREFFEAKAREGSENLRSESNQAALTNSLIRAVQAILLAALVGQLLGNGSKKNPIRSWPMFAKVH